MSGDVGSLPGDELFDAIRQLSRLSGPVRLKAVAVEDIYTTGPIQIELRIEPVRTAEE